MDMFSELYKYQPIATKIVQNAYRQKRVAHAFAISGAEETQLHLFAQWFMAVFSCDNNDDGFPCGECVHCKQILKDEYIGTYIIEPDGASIKKEQIVDMQKHFATYGLTQGARFYVINQAHTMTISAANSLLKFLEEPSSNVYALLVTKSPDMMPITIQSRVQQLQLNIMGRELVIKKLINDGHSERLATIAYELGYEELDEEAAKQLASLTESALLYLGNIDVAQINPLVAQMDLEAQVKNKNQADNFFTILLILLNDILDVKSEKKEATLFGIDDIEKKNTIKTIAEKMDTIITAQKYLHANVSSNLALSLISLRWNAQKEGE